MKRIIVLSLVLVLCMAGIADAKAPRKAPRARAQAVTAEASREMYELGIVIDYSRTERTRTSLQFCGPAGGAYEDSAGLFVFRIPTRPHGAVEVVNGAVVSVSEDATYITVKVRPVWSSLFVMPGGATTVRGLATITL